MVSWWSRGLREGTSGCSSSLPLRGCSPPPPPSRQLRMLRFEPKISYWRQVTVVSEDKVEFSGAVVDVDKDAVTVLQVIKSKIKFKPWQITPLGWTFRCHGWIAAGHVYWRISEWWRSGLFFCSLILPSLWRVSSESPSLTFELWTDFVSLGKPSECHPSAFSQLQLDFSFSALESSWALLWFEKEWDLDWGHSHWFGTLQLFSRLRSSTQYFPDLR